MSEKQSMLEGFIMMSLKAKIISITVIILFALFIYFALGGFRGSDCGCDVPKVDIPRYSDSFDDIKANWEFKECSMTESKELAEKIHIYVYFNSKLKKYRCQLLYSWPGANCRLTSKNFGMNAITTGEISVSDFESGNWKSYEYWLARQY